MSIDALKQELASLGPRERRHVQAFLVALEDSHDGTHRKELARKIDQPAEKFATLQELDRRLAGTRRTKP